MSDITPAKAVAAVAALVSVTALLVGYLVVSGLSSGRETKEPHHRPPDIVPVDAMRGRSGPETTVSPSVPAASSGSENPAALRQRLDRRCSSGEADACYELGLMWRSGRGGAESASQARALVSLACERGHAPACSLVPLMAKP